MTQTNGSNRNDPADHSAVRGLHDRLVDRRESAVAARIDAEDHQIGVLFPGVVENASSDCRCRARVHLQIETIIPGGFDRLSQLIDGLSRRLCFGLAGDHGDQHQLTIVGVGQRLADLDQKWSALGVGKRDHDPPEPTRFGFGRFGLHGDHGGQYRRASRS